MDMATYGVNRDADQTRHNRVRELRMKELMTQEQLAYKAQLALRTIHSVEKGQICRMATKRKIVVALGRSFDERHEVFPDY